MPLKELEQINAIVGLSMKIEGWPSTLADLGYVLDRIELKFKIPDPKRAGISIYINPDLLFVADVRNFSLITELKSGRFQGLEQLNRFVSITPKELILYGGMPVRDQSHAMLHKIGVAEIVNDEFLIEYLSEFTRVNHAASLVSLGTAEIKAHHATLTDSRLDAVLKRGVSLRGFHRPTKLVPVLPTSDDEYGLISSVVNAVKLLWLRNTRNITPGVVGGVVFKQLWDRFDRDAHRRYVAITKEVLGDMLQTELHAYLRPVANDNDKWALLELPESVDDRRRTRASQTFADSIQRYKWRRKNNAPYDRSRHSAQVNFEDVPGYLPNKTEADEDK
ncbi:MAG TPA: hypothetical protein VF397_11570 [Pyrinomonadaceae bacterium]